MKQKYCKSKLQIPKTLQWDTEHQPIIQSTIQKSEEITLILYLWCRGNGKDLIFGKGILQIM